MGNFKIAIEISASPGTLYSIQCTVHSSILTLLTVHNEMNYKRSVRMRFSTGFIQKKMMAHRSTFRQVLLSLSLVAQMKCPPISPADIIDKLHCDFPTHSKPRFLQGHIPVSQISRDDTTIKVKKLPEVSRTFWKLRIEVELIDERRHCKVNIKADCNIVVHTSGVDPYLIRFLSS
jgi:hypothetical protein